QIVRRRPVLAGGRQLAVVAEIDDVWADLVERDRRGGTVEAGTILGLPLARQVERHWYAELRDPHVGRVHEPILLRQQRESARTPRGAPRVLHDEAVAGVAAERDSMAAVGAAHPLDHRQPESMSALRVFPAHLAEIRAAVDVEPALVNHQARVQDAD